MRVPGIRNSRRRRSWWKTVALTSLGATIEYAVLLGISGFDCHAIESEIALRHSFYRLTPMLAGR